MTVRTALARALWVPVLAAWLGGCANLPFFGDDGEKAAAGTAAEAKPEPELTLFELDVQAPVALRTLLLDYLDLARFQKAPRTEAVTDAEIERLVAVAPAQARSLLETEGYFEAGVKVAQTRGASGLPRIEVTVVPGPRVVVGSVAVDATQPLAPRLPTRASTPPRRRQRSP